MCGLGMFQKKAAIYTLHGEDPCATVRLLSPLSAAGLKIYKPDPEEEIDKYELIKCNFIIIQRNYPKLLSQYTRVMEIARANHIPVVFEIDDLLFDLPADHIERVNNIFTEGLLPMLQAVLEADCVTVPTEALRSNLAPFNNNIKVIPNYLDNNIWTFRKPEHQKGSSRVVIGYMGTETHKPDLEMLVPTFAELEKKHPGKLTLRIWGISEMASLAGFESVEYLAPITDSYTNFAHFFQTQSADIFVAPLRNNAFNRCKSPIKFFEYSVLGAPGVYSNLEPYQNVVNQGSEGFLAENPTEWFEFLEKLIESPSIRYQMAENAQKCVRAKWLLSDHANEIQAAYDQITVANNQETEFKRHQLNLIRSINDQYHSLANRKSDEILQLKTELNEVTAELNRKSDEILQLEAEINGKNATIQSLSFELNEIHISKTWKIALLLRKARLILAPPNSRRFKLAKNIYHFLQGEKIRIKRASQDKILNKDFDIRPVVQTCGQIAQHTQTVDIIVCVHNALEDVKRCLNSIVEHTNKQYELIIVDDGSDDPTREFLEKWSNGRNSAKLMRNEKAQGYTLAANIGMRASIAEFLVLLNSDTIVCEEWLDRLCQAMDRNEKIGVVGPLSNTASWQSIPELSDGSDWAMNPLPKGVTVDKMAELVSKYSACIHPEVPLLNGFCLMIRKKALEQIGFFDEVNFGQGYGEEDDFNLRAEKKGWRKVVADDVYIYHAQSKSYSSERRYQLSHASGVRLHKKHGSETIARQVAFMNPNRVMEGIRARTKVMLEREEIIERGHDAYAGKRILFVLPVIDAGGGANVILDEARCMQEMSVDVHVMNLTEYKHAFLQNYKHSSIPFIFEDIENLAQVAENFDAVVATANYSVPWFKPLEKSKAILGYYVQGFEALMYPEGSPEAQAAMNTYTLIEGMRLFTKTEWTKQQVFEHTGAICETVGVSANIDLFRPRDSIPLGSKPVHIGAMIRPSSPYRNPEFTARILRDVKKKYNNQIEIYLFGADDVAEIVSPELLDYDYHQLGKLTQLQVAALMSKLDVFTDYSSHQAMGLSALEAMCAGATVIVPRNGGAVEFVRHKENGIVVDTTNFQDSMLGLEELIENDTLRKQLQLNAIHDVTNYYPEKAAYNIMHYLFGS